MRLFLDLLLSFRFFVLLYLLPSCLAFQLTNFGPKNYAPDELVDTTVNTISPSYGAEHGSDIFNYEYYDNRFHFCRPDSIIQQPESLGSVLFGDRLYNSPLELRMLKNASCVPLCASNISKSDIQFLKDLISQNYVVHWNIDNLPIATYAESVDSNEYLLTPGFPLGRVTEEGIILYNHYNITIEYHTSAENQHRVVGAYLKPVSRKSNFENGNAVCSTSTSYEILPEHDDLDFVTSFSVTWKYSDTPWATRWDKYMHGPSNQVRWMFLLYSGIFDTFLIFIVCLILFRTLNRDINKYNSAFLDQEDVQEDFGWKLVHGDVFRPPRRPMLFSILLGNGAQLLFMTSAIILLAIFGFIAPSRRGSLATAVVALFIVSGFVSGFVSSISYKLMQGMLRKRNLLLTPFVVPGFLLAGALFFNIVFSVKNSSSAVPFTSWLLLIVLYLVFTVPLSFAGSLIGFRSREFVPPVRTNQIPRQIPTQSIWISSASSALIGGSIPFVAILIELYFILDSLWFHPLYFMFGFSFFCFGILITTCVMVSIITVYIQLCTENYNWWWRSFITPGFCGVYVFVFSIIYWLNRISSTSFATTLLYFGYSLMISVLVFFLCGSVGFFGSFLFVNRIYGSIKID
ncbi:EMP70 family protein [Schizosaccharomyces cryophilus OY26]|uniref:Transmembrane 9 superfamily member n=1 Tax=Schizosaccharomyces cryophilus (strain OY26 / ATCC MYA-4695 / CBS 11777 / NBRC 106824 / NRRL Y48691) TaxID=653667 RepID=S9W5C5_SCHCR|nr:EMP70 family protein [Schizosaccharomyces cryophilus OY26]EPY53764.1 EMP70 family protein [Schizosaccharomyces cryophilus OY26]